MSSPIVVFDLDGTLVDTAPDLVAALNTILAREGLRALEYARARSMIGGGARMLIERGLAAQGRVLPVVQIERMVRDFIDHYAAHIADRSVPYPGVQAALEQLSADGFRLAVCTNKLEWLSIKLLETLGMAGRFSAICGADAFGTRKPDPAALCGTIERAGGDLGRAVMIGDSITDVATARSAGIAVVAVDFGYTEVPVAKLEPDRVVSSFADIPVAVWEVLRQNPQFREKRQ